MPVIRYTGTSVYNLNGGPTFTEQDPMGEVNESEAERLTGRVDFERVEEQTDSDGSVDEEPDSMETESEPEEIVLSELSHEELKEHAETLGITEDVDLRSRDTIITGIREYTDESE